MNSLSTSCGLMYQYHLSPRSFPYEFTNLYNHESDLYTSFAPVNEKACHINSFCCILSNGDIVIVQPVLLVPVYMKYHLCNAICSSLFLRSIVIFPVGVFHQTLGIDKKPSISHDLLALFTLVCNARILSSPFVAGSICGLMVSHSSFISSRIVYAFIIAWIAYRVHMGVFH